MVARRNPTYTLFPLSLLCISSVHAASECYFPDGTQDVTQTPCNAAAEYSSCCAGADVCLTNGYCFQQSGGYANRLARGTCTDPTWKSTGCPQHCADVASDGTDSLYLAYDDPSSLFCCSHGGVAFNATTNACNVATQGSTQPFTVDRGQVIYDRSNGDVLPALNSSSNITTNNINCSRSSTATVALAVGTVLGFLLITAIVAIALLWNQLRMARRLLRQNTSSLSPPAFDDAVGERQKAPLMEHYASEDATLVMLPPKVDSESLPYHAHQPSVHEAPPTEQHFELSAQQEAIEAQAAPGT